MRWSSTQWPTLAEIQSVLKSKFGLLAQRIKRTFKNLRARLRRLRADGDEMLVPDTVPVWPRPARLGALQRMSASHLMIEAPCLHHAQSNHAVEKLFRSQPGLHALAVVDDEQRPIGIISRRVFTEHMSRPFAKVLNARRTCAAHMREVPILRDIDDSLTELEALLEGKDHRYLADGFVVTQDGRYRGLGTGVSLVRRITEQRIEAARYSNPLTLLPGNIRITEHIERLREADKTYVLAYADLNHFKPFNDRYGYLRGDRMIRLAANVHLRHADPQRDFVGHIGGDDFVTLFQSADWQERCLRIIEDFNTTACDLFDAADRARGELLVEDRNGHPVRFR